MGTFLQDLRYGIRVLVRTPAFTLGVVATLALTIGASTAVFSVVRTVLLRPLPFGDPSRLVWITSMVAPGRRDGPFSLPEFLDYCEQARSLDTLIAYATYSTILSGDGPAERLQGVRISADAFTALGVAPASGRLLVAADDAPEAARVAVIGYALWQRRFGGDPGVVGRTVRLNSEPHVVIGVMPRHFPLPLREIDIVVPLAPGRDPWRAVRTSTNFLRFIGVLKSDVSIGEADGELNSIERRLREQYPTPYAAKMGVALKPLHEQLVSNYQQSLWLLLAAVVLVTAVACANLINLLLARAIVREHEVALRMALGAGQWAIARQVISETLLLTAAGGVSGLLLAIWARDLLVRLGPPDLPRLQETSIDWTVVGFTAAVSVVVAFVFTIVPLWHVRRSNARLARSRGDHGGRGAARARSLVVVSEVALAVLLVVCATLVVRSLLKLQQIDVGFDTTNVTVARISLPRAQYAKREALLQFADRFAEGLHAIPGVRAVGGSNIQPLSGVIAYVNFLVDGRPAPAGKDLPEAQFRVVTDDYVAAMGVPLIAGRAFQASDTETTRPVALVNRRLANQFFPEGNAVGAHLLVGDNTAGRRPIEIVGVVGDVRQVTLDGDPTFDIYIALKQVHDDTLVWLANNQFWMVRSEGDPGAIGESIRRALDRADPNVGLASIRSGDDYIESATRGRRFTTSLLAGFALSALLLALIGLYAVMAYAVAQRTRELGVRMAMGATRLTIATLILRHALLLLGTGAALGLMLAVPATSAMGNLLYETAPMEPAVFAAVALALCVAGTATALVPAGRATRIDPVVALRE
jgi:putative ABC transport system permease protein